MIMGICEYIWEYILYIYIYIRVSYNISLT